MKRKKLVELPQREKNVPAGYYMIKAGESRAIFDAKGNQKPPAKVRTLDQPKKGHRRPEHKSRA
jgi:hypothetical protein